MTERPDLYVVGPDGEEIGVSDATLARRVDAAIEDAHAGDARLLRDLLLAGVEPAELWAAIKGDTP
jgi:hypothetical protein